MTWQAVRAEDEALWTEQYLTEVRQSHARLPLPPRQQKIGGAWVLWNEVDPGVFVVHAQGGTVDDRNFVRYIVAQQLTAYGLQPAEFSLGGPELRKTAAWADIMEKAQRLRQEGKVQVLRNGANVIVGHVQGDHGDYQTEISRDDPSSNVITTWQCECPWDQFAWQRTRKWKKYEGRVCSHVLATYWQASTMPLDEEYDPAAGATVGPTGQLGFPGMGPTAQPAPRGAGPGPGPAAQNQQLSIPGIFPGAAEATPPVPGADILPPAPMPPMPPPTSVPGGKQPTADNPIQYPGGTYSKVAQETYPVHRMEADVAYHAAPVSAREAIAREGLRGNDQTFHNNSSGVYLGLLPEIAHEWGASALKPGGIGKHGVDYDVYEVNTSGLPLVEDKIYTMGSVLHQGHIPPERIRLVPEAPNRREVWTDGSLNEIHERAQREPLWHIDEDNNRIDGGTYSSWHFAAKDDVFNNSDMVRLEDEEMGVAEGKSVEHGAGQYRPIPKNSIGEVLGQDPTTGWVDVIFPIHDTGPMEPYHIRAWIEPEKLTPMPNIKRPGPFIRRRTKVAVDKDKYLYHVAPTEERNRIMAHGLFPSKPALSDRWDGHFDQSPEGVYVYKDEADAINSGIFEGAPVDVWRVPKTAVRGLELDPVIPNAYALRTHVPAELHLPWEHREDVNERAEEEMTWRDWHENDHIEDPDEALVREQVGVPIPSSQHEWVF